MGLTLSLYFGTDGLGAWPSQETLARRTGLSLRFVRDALKRLIAEKWLSATPRKGPRGIRSPRWGFEYRARLPKNLADALANGARPALFNGRDPSRETAADRLLGKNEARGAQSIRHPVPTNTSSELIKSDAFKKGNPAGPEFPGGLVDPFIVAIERAEAEERRQ